MNGKNEKWENRIIFFSVIGVMLLANWINQQRFYIATPDGNLYLSVASNFIKNGHFIQTARPNEVCMIVPPGLPLICTIIMGLTYNYLTIVIAQYILFGLSAVLLTKTSRFLYDGRWNSTLIPILFVSACLYVGSPNPGEILTETYTVFSMALTAFLLFHPNLSRTKKISYLVSILFFSCLIRPVVGGVLVIALFVMLGLTMHREISIRRLTAYMLTICAVLALNTLINYRETGYAIILENYGGIPLYQANNSNTKTQSYSSDLVEEFSDDYFMQVYFDKALDTNQRNALLKERAGEFIQENPEVVLKNTIDKYSKMFCLSWNWNFYVLFLALAGFVLSKRMSKCYAVLILLSFGLITIVPAMGLFIFRYAVPCIPFYVVINGTFYIFIAERLWGKVKGHVMAHG